MEALLDGLNDAQRHAVTTPAEVVQVLAPPGSGKTKTLTARVAYLVKHVQLKPWNIIVCTFTIKAAREMRDRIRGMVGDGIESKLILGTFHSVARRFLVRYGQEIGIEKNFGIIDTNDSLAKIKRIIQRFDYGVDPKHARSRISGLKAKGITADQFVATTKKADEHEFACVYSAYEEDLKISNSLDYDDLLLRCTELLRKHPTCVASIEAVLIDEYQDTNNVQYELMTLMAQRKKRITIVGDPDQSIYGFRSAEIKNLYKMRDDFPDSLVINLENNYRSSGCILFSAMAVIEQDESRPQKALQATHAIGEQPTLRHLRDAATEAQWIIREMTRSKTLAAGILNYKDYAILVRGSTLLPSIEKALGKAGIPYRMVGGQRFFDRAEIKLVLDYLHVINHPGNNDALCRIINNPKRGIGDTKRDALLAEAESKKMTLWDMIQKIARGVLKPACELKPQAQKGIDTLVNIILTSRQKLFPKEGEECNLFDVISHVLNKLAFQTYLKKQYKEQWEDRWQNVEELVGQATQLASNGEDFADDALPVVEGIEQRPDTAADILSKFLANVALSSAVESEDGEEVDRITICTIHAAKGLEWPVVFIPGVYDGSIPHSRNEDQDEERRLLYVGMTRAQGLLYLSCPVKGSRQEETTLSRFVSERTMEKYFSVRGPSIGCSTITDLALILRRPCPSQTDVDAARESLEHIEDDQYPAKREDIDVEGPKWGSYDFEEPQAKRRKTTSTAIPAGYGAAPTMHIPSSFSIAKTTVSGGKGGFVTAKDLQQEIIQEAKAVGTLIGASSLAAGKRAYTESKNMEARETKTDSGKGVKARPAGQGAITSFFSKPASTTAVTATATAAAPKIPSLPRSQSTGSTFRASSLSQTHPSSSNLHAPSLSRSQSTGDDLKALCDISNTQAQPSRQRPQSLFSSHRPREAPMLHKPKRPEADDDDGNIQNTRYILLSSSPVKPDEKEDMQPPQYSDENDVDPPEPQSPTKRKTVTSGIRPASTFHTTSVGQLQNASGPPRKTLGLGRSMQGWSVKHTQMPRPR